MDKIVYCLYLERNDVPLRNWCKEGSDIWIASCEGSEGIKKVLDGKYNVNEVMFSQRKSLCKNLMFQKVKNDYDYAVFIEDSIRSFKHSLIQDYIDTIKMWDCGIAFYGFLGNQNRTFMDVPNPAVEMKTSKDETCIVNRFSADSLIVIDLKKFNDSGFDTRMSNYGYFDEFLVRAKAEGKTKFYGFFYDVNKSWEMVKRNSTPSKLINLPQNSNLQLIKQLRNADEMMMNHLRAKAPIDLNLDQFIQYSLEKIKEKIES